MKLLFTHDFACDPVEFWSLVMDPVFSRETDHEARVDKTVLDSRVEQDGRKYQHMRFFYLDPLPRIVAKILGSANLTYEQIQRVDDAARTLEWQVIPPISKDKFRAEGNYRVVAGPQGCTRIIQGEVEVRVPLVGRKIEEGIIEQIKKGYEQGATIIQRRLAQR